MEAEDNGSYQLATFTGYADTGSELPGVTAITTMGTYPVLHVMSDCLGSNSG